MDYKNKYFKYKQKYIILKGGVGPDRNQRPFEEQVPQRVAVGPGEIDENLRVLQRRAAVIVNEIGDEIVDENLVEQVLQRRGAFMNADAPAGERPRIIGVGPAGEPPRIIGVGPGRDAEVEDDIPGKKLIDSDPEKAIELVNIYIGELTENKRLLDQKIIELKELNDRLISERMNVYQQNIQKKKRLEDLKLEYEQTRQELLIKRNKLSDYQTLQKKSDQEILLIKQNIVRNLTDDLQKNIKLSHQKQIKEKNRIDDIEKMDAFQLLNYYQTKEIILKREISQIEERLNRLRTEFDELKVEFLALNKKLDDLNIEFNTTRRNYLQLSNDKILLSRKLEDAQKHLEKCQLSLEKKKFPERVKLREEEHDKDLQRRGLVAKKNWPIWYKEFMEIHRGLGFDRYLDATKEYPNKSDVVEDRNSLFANYERIVWINDLVPQWWLDGLKEKLYIENKLIS
jgi:hypothetical protein